MSDYLSSDNQESKSRIWAIVATLIFHGIMVIFLLGFALRTPLPLPGEEGVEVNLGNSDMGMGDIQPEEAALLKSSTPPQQPSKADDEMITEDSEESPALEKVNKKTNKPSNTQVTKPKPEPEASREPVVNPNAIYKGKSNKTSQGGNQGTTGQPGDQGKPGGSPDGKGMDGLGGKGAGISFDLGGRGAKELPKPTYDSDEQGRVVVTIYVNREGIVTRVQAGARGTTLSDQKLWKQAEKAALRTRFNPDPNAPEIQKGTIKYTFLKTR